MSNTRYDFQFLEECLREQLVVFLQNAETEDSPDTMTDLVDGLHDYDEANLADKPAIDDIFYELGRFVNLFKDHVEPRLKGQRPTLRESEEAEGFDGISG